jgi:predicted dehydrogenase
MHPATRRRFLATASVGVPALAFPAILSARNPNGKLRVAVIGCGGRGAGNLRECLGEEVVALCDVNARNLEAARQQCPEARTYRDFRELHAAELDRVDAVVVSTTEHTHAFAVLPALRAGKHVYCEKPLTRDIAECRLVTETAAARPGVVTQMGTQIHAGENYRRVVELVRAQAIGPVREVHVWVSRAWGRQSAEEAAAHKDIVHVLERPADSAAEPVPPELDWDLWLGPAPWRPYHSVYFPGPKWYRWWDFGNGTMSDLGSHWNDLPWWALDLDAPLTVEAGGPPPHPELAPASMWARYTYGPRGSRPGLTLTWHQGTEKPEIWKSGGIPPWPNGVLFIGDGGMILSDYSKHLLLPEGKFTGFVPPKPSIPPSPGQQKEWLEACKSGGTTGCPFSYSGPLTEANHLGNVAYRAGRKLTWDAAAMRFTDAPDAGRFLSRTYREGWSLGASPA